MHLNQAINSIRISKRLTQKEVSDKSGLQKSWFSLIENGHKIPNITTLARIADSMGVKIWQIMWLVEEVEKGEPISDRFTDLLLEFDELENYISAYLHGEQNFDLQGEPVLKQLNLVDLERK